MPAGQKDNVGEGCVTTTWLQLNYQLFCISGDMKYLNELERSVYNQLTAAENPQTGCVSYFTPLSGVKPFSCNITCCMSSVPRGIAMIPLFANGTINGNPTFLLYQAGKFETTVNNTPVSFVTTTNFPTDGDVSINVNTNKPTSFGVAFRKPYWAADFSIRVNGEKIALKEDENTVIVNRIWKKDDAITIHFSMPVLVLDGGKSYPKYLALQRGPQVLSVDNTLNTLNFDEISINPTTIQLESTPSVLPEKWVGSEAFQLKMDNKNIIFVPFADASQTGGKVETWLKKGN